MIATPHTPARLFRFRWLLRELVLRDLRLRYRGSVLGFAWTLLNPLLFMAIYTLVFSVYLRVPVEHFPLFLLSGLIPFTWFSMALQQGATAILDGRMYVGKTTFPTEVLIAVPVFSNAMNFALSLPLLAIFAIFAHVHLGAALLSLPAIILIQLVMTYGAVQILATLNVFYRDLQQLVTYAITALFYLSPIFYMQTQVPARFQFLVQLNPLSALINSYHAIFYSGTLPSAGDITFAGITAVVMVLVGQGLFVRYCDSFGQYL